MSSQPVRQVVAQRWIAVAAAASSEEKYCKFCLQFFAHLNDANFSKHVAACPRKKEKSEAEPSWWCRPTAGCGKKISSENHRNIDVHKRVCKPEPAPQLNTLLELFRRPRAAVPLASPAKDPPGVGVEVLASSLDSDVLEV